MVLHIAWVAFDVGVGWWKLRETSFLTADLRGLSPKRCMRFFLRFPFRASRLVKIWGGGSRVDRFVLWCADGGALLLSYVHLWFGFLPGSYLRWPFLLFPNARHFYRRRGYASSYTSRFALFWGMIQAHAVAAAAQVTMEAEGIAAPLAAVVASPADTGGFTANASGDGACHTERWVAAKKRNGVSRGTASRKRIKVPSSSDTSSAAVYCSTQTQGEVTSFTHSPVMPASSGLAGGPITISQTVEGTCLPFADVPGGSYMHAVYVNRSPPQQHIQIQRHHHLQQLLPHHQFQQIQQQHIPEHQVQQHQMLLLQQQLKPESRDDLPPTEGDVRAILTWLMRRPLRTTLSPALLQEVEREWWRVTQHSQTHHLHPTVPAGVHLEVPHPSVSKQEAEVPVLETMDPSSLDTEHSQIFADPPSSQQAGGESLCIGSAVGEGRLDLSCALTVKQLPPHMPQHGVEQQGLTPHKMNHHQLRGHGVEQRSIQQQSSGSELMQQGSVVSQRDHDCFTSI